MKTKQLNAIIEKAQKEKFSYAIGGKTVSEHKFFRNLIHQMHGKPKKKFHWTDKKVRLLLSCFELEITDEQLNNFKRKAI